MPIAYAAAARRALGVDAQAGSRTRGARPAIRHGSMCSVTVPPTAARRSVPRGNGANDRKVAKVAVEPTPVSDNKKKEKTRTKFRGTKSRVLCSKTNDGSPEYLVRRSDPPCPPVSRDPKPPKVMNYSVKAVRSTPAEVAPSTPGKPQRKPHGNGLVVTLNGRPIDRIPAKTFASLLAVCRKQIEADMKARGVVPTHEVVYPPTRAQRRRAAARHRKAPSPDYALHYRIQEHFAYLQATQPELYQELFPRPELFQELFNKLHANPLAPHDSGSPQAPARESPPAPVASPSRAGPPPDDTDPDASNLVFSGPAPVFTDKHLPLLSNGKATYLELLQSRFADDVRRFLTECGPYPPSDTSDPDILLSVTSFDSSLTVAQRGGYVPSARLPLEPTFLQVLKNRPSSDVRLIRELVFVYMAYCCVPSSTLQSHAFCRTVHVNILKNLWFFGNSFATPSSWAFLHGYAREWASAALAHHTEVLTNFGDPDSPPGTPSAPSPIDCCPTTRSEDFDEEAGDSIPSPIQCLSSSPTVRPRPSAHRKQPIKAYCSAVLSVPVDLPTVQEAPSSDADEITVVFEQANALPTDDTAATAERDDSPFVAVTADRPRLRPEADSPPVVGIAPSGEPSASEPPQRPERPSALHLPSPRESEGISALSSPQALRPEPIPDESPVTYTLRSLQYSHVLDLLTAHAAQVSSFDPSAAVDQYRSLDLESLRLVADELSHISRSRADSPRASAPQTFSARAFYPSSSAPALGSSTSNPVPSTQSVPTESPVIQESIASGNLRIASHLPPDPDPDSSDSDSSDSSSTSSSSSISVAPKRSALATKGGSSSSKSSSRDAATIAKQIMAQFKKVNPDRLFSFDKNPTKRMSRFMKMHTSLITYVDMIPELQDCLTNPQDLKTPKTPEANSALSVVLRGLLDDSLRSSVDQFLEYSGDLHDGIALYKFLVQTCVRHDPVTREQYSLAFRKLSIHRHSAISQFNVKFLDSLSRLRSAGETWSNESLVDRYLQSLRTHDVTGTEIKRIECERVRLRESQKGKTKSRFALSSLMLEFARDHDLYLESLGEEHQSKKGASQQSLRQRATSQSSKPGQASANSVGSSKDNKRRKSDKPLSDGDHCFGCHKTTHKLSQCPTTSKEQKRILYDKHLRGVDSKPPRAGASSTQSNKSKPRSKSNANANSVTFEDDNNKPIDALPSTDRAASANSAAAGIRHAFASHTFCSAVGRKSTRSPASKSPSGLPVVQHYSADDILLDSGASHHMTGNPDALVDLEEVISHVTLPDGTTVESPMTGTMIVAVVDLDSGRTYRIPLRQTLYVPGLRQSLWSAGAYHNDGHVILFEQGHVFVTASHAVNGETKIDIIKLNHPYLANRSYFKPMHPDKLAATSVVRAYANAVGDAFSLSDRRPPDERRKRTVKLVDSDLLHRRLGHVSTGSLLVASKEEMWADTKITLPSEPFCHGCNMGMIRTSARTQHPVAPRDLSPGQGFFVDIVDNVENHGLTSDSHFAKYLLLTCALSKYTVLVGLPSQSTDDVIAALNYFCLHHGPRLGFTVSDIDWLHPDAGSQFVPSAEFQQWCADHGIRPSAAAPHHQHQNGMVERRWQHLKGLANKMMTHARLPRKFFGHALQYAWMIANLTPVKDVYYTDIDGVKNPCTPFERYFGQAPTIERFRVFGCPVVFKLHRRTARETGPRGSRTRVLTSSNIIQRGGRGIFVGFPHSQAGWLIYVPASDRLITSCDVAFDEDFTSILAFDRGLFLDAEPARAVGTFPNPLTASPYSLAQSGPPPISIQVPVPEHAPWTPYTALPSGEFRPVDFAPPFVDLYDLSAREHAILRTPGQLCTGDPSMHKGVSLPESIAASRDIDVDTQQAIIASADELPYVYEPTSPCYTPDSTPPTSPLPDPQAILNLSDDDDVSMPDAFDTGLSLVETLANAPSLPILPEADCQVYEEDPSDIRLLDVRPSTTPSPSRHRSTAAVLPKEPSRRSERLRKKPRLRYHHASHRAMVSAVKQIAELDPKDAAALVVAQLHSVNVSPPTEYLSEEGSVEDPSGQPPALYLPEPKSIRHILRYTSSLLRKQWIAAFTKEVRGLIRMGTFAFEDCPPDLQVLTLQVVFKCKLKSDGTVDKLKGRVVFPGNRYRPTIDLDPWNPHATFEIMCLYLALASYLGMTISQVDFVMAYLQAKMREKVFVRFPPEWADVLPPECRRFCHVPLRLSRALYGYTFSGKFLYEDQSEFLTSIGFERMDQAPAIWVYRPAPGERPTLMILQYSDDWLVASSDDASRLWFRTKLEARFNVDWTERAQWYLQARIHQYPNGDISLDQYRYSRLIVERYLPSFANLEVSQRDLRRFRSPLPSDFKWSADDCSASDEEVRELERQFGFRYIEAVGSLNYLSGTAIEELYATRKACKYMRRPGAAHFKAVLHLLHHIRCHPPKALRFYRDVSQSPLAGLIAESSPNVNPLFVAYSDSSFADSDNALSTGAYLIFFSGGPVSFSSFVPPLIAMSTAEAEMNALCSACMTATAIRSIVSQVLYGDSTRPYTVPVFTDSEAARLMASSEKVNARNRHIERRMLFPRLAQSKGLVSVEYVHGDSGQLADLGTKSLDSSEPSVLRKLSVFETTCPDLLPVDSSPSAPSASSVARVSPDRHAEDPDMPKKGDEIRHAGSSRIRDSHGYGSDAGVRTTSTHSHVAHGRPHAPPVDRRTAATRNPWELPRE